MRLYTFVNGLYMRPIQFGIQSTHLLGDMFVKYNPIDTVKRGSEIDVIERTAATSKPRRMLFDWAENHKTMVILDAVNVQGLMDIFEFLDTPENPFPFGKFHEDEQSLGGVITCAGVVVPERIYETAANMRRNPYSYANGWLKVTMPVSYGSDVLLVHEKELTKFEFDLCERLNQYGLAR